jgi:hypothetical protein
MYFYIVILVLTVAAPAAYQSIRTRRAQLNGVSAARLRDSPLQVGLVIALSWIIYAFAVQLGYHLATANVLKTDEHPSAVPTFEQARELGRWHEWLPPSALMVRNATSR